ncbi:Phospholipase ABHD3 [Hondaea fermentalgiana]|uniref:Phospholipase ABHD3 n=1 Tax=Hondaea fermentalgiana TaxID=2315210 RepID=A0A2R5GKU6_9STRA|nr:Phospholipase ABHD3 [Hondaea fermentalgiana]|eukprot:GBG28494.1 Phospholipase ABHD3 [Hondaea fermentalgiana]
MLYKALHRNSLPVRRHTVKCEDGGEVAVDVYGPPRGKPELPDEAPLMLIMHTITGTTQDEMELAAAAYAKGWRACLLVRRGHMGTLSHPKFNLMGCVDDSRRMIAKAQEVFPKASFIGACGISAGSGQVVSYIGQQPAGGPVQAAVSLCPAYSIENAFANFQQRSPLLAAFILASLKSFFLTPNEHVLRDSKGFQECLESTSVQNFMQAHAQLAGFPDFQTYLANSNPMQHYAGSRVPCLILNALDDPLCVEENIRYDIASETENYCLCLTDYGSHVTFREGLLGQSSFMHRVALDFLEAARRDFLHSSRGTSQ